MLHVVASLHGRRALLRLDEYRNEKISLQSNILQTKACLPTSATACWGRQASIAASIYTTYATTTTEHLQTNQI